MTPNREVPISSEFEKRFTLEMSLPTQDKKDLLRPPAC